MAVAVSKRFVAAAVISGLLLSATARAEDELKVAHVLVGSKAEAEAVAKEITAAGNDAKSFKQAVYKHSKDAATKPLGGMLPTWLRDNGSYDVAFTRAAFELQAGQISGPVKSQFGWHLIQVLERRAKGGAGVSKGGAGVSKGGAGPSKDSAGLEKDGTATKSADTGQPFDPIAQATKIAEQQAAAAKAKAEAAAAAKAADGKAADGKAADGKATTVVSAPVVPQPVNARRRPASKGRKASLVIESVLSERLAQGNQRSFLPTEAVELNLMLKNESADPVKVPSPGLLPLGFVVTRLSDSQTMPADFGTMADPADFFVELRTWQIVGEVVSLNDHFKTLSASGRYELKWDGKAFFNNLEARFPKAIELPDYPAIKTSLTGVKGLVVDQVFRDASPSLLSRQRKGFSFSVFPRVDAKAKYYARLKLKSETTPVIFELSGTKYGNKRAVGQFIKLANDGFYDALNFYDVQKDSYALGGCPSSNGLGAPAMRLPNGLKNDDQVQHTRGTVSFVTRTSPRQGPIKGGEIGSIFFVSLKDHSEWDSDHVPFGKVVEGLEVFDRLDRNKRIESVAILTPEEYDATGSTVAVTGAADGGTGAADGGDATIIVSGYPQAIIKTAKGDLKISLYDDVAYHTIASFITRAEAGFFDKGPDDGKMSFFDSLDQGGKTIALMTGSPTNDATGGPGYKLRDEVNAKKCERGALVMLKEQDEVGGYVPNSAGSAFFICVQPIPFFDFEGKFTVFGRVTSGLETLDKLAKGDEITEVQITKKKKRAYESFRKAN